MTDCLGRVQKFKIFHVDERNFVNILQPVCDIRIVAFEVMLCASLQIIAVGLLLFYVERATTFAI